MKKTLMVVSFALCASLAFAQSNNVVVNATSVGNDMARNVSTELVESQAGYTGSIFTKDGNTYFSCGFALTEANKYSTGIVGANELVDGTIIPQHTNLGDYGHWNRIPDSAYIMSNDFAETFPVIASVSFRSWLANSFKPETKENGFMLMSMIDNYGGWGGDNDPGLFDAWIRFQAIDLSDCGLAAAQFYRLYRKFNYDKTYLDYSLDGGTTWHAIEFDVKNVDVATNSNILGTKRLTLPRSLAGQSNVTFRIRYVDESDAANPNGGYFLALDDFTVVDAPDNHLRFTSNQYFEGFYQMMPQGLQVPVVWASDFYNDGNYAQTNAVGKVYTYASGDNATVLAQKDLGTVVAIHDSARAFVIDPMGYYDSADEYHGFVIMPDSSYTTGAYACLPTSENGANYFFTAVNTDYYAADSLVFDTLRYTVNWGTVTDNAGSTHPAGIWARDHGVITYNGDGTNGAGNYYTPGMVGSSTWGDDFESTKWNKAGYGNMVGYVTGNTIPNDWRILGVEMVASTTPGMQGVGATIVPILWQDVPESSSSISFRSPDTNIGTGVSYYTITQSDVNVITGTSNFEYRTIAQGYNTIRILFPNQLPLEANTVYRIGYVLNEDADFAVAECRASFMRNGSTVYFEDEPGMSDYKNILYKNNGNGNYYSVLTRDMYGGSAQVRFFNTARYPMIRMIVGPSYHITKYRVEWQCEDKDLGSFISLNNDNLCDTYDSVAEGYPVQFYIQPEYGYIIDSVTINGIATDQYELAVDADGNQYAILEVESVTEDLVFNCYFKERPNDPSSIDPVAGRVSMKLQPNPATSNVFVTLKGVTGSVNMSLLDMSGRVVTTSQFNAENGANINVSNLPKGAYFVRITNNNFTKIEKLIVR